MKDKKKTKEQLINEMAEMRKPLAELEKSEIDTRKLKAMVKEKEEFLKDTLDSIQDGISPLDKNLNIIFTNSAMERWYAHQCLMLYYLHPEVELLDERKQCDWEQNFPEESPIYRDTKYLCFAVSVFCKRLRGTS